ncbi:hypothetical protein BC829DRAFT_86557 [Chytridium lagenaria]|nr:hypothetical protein BC829DRAFT_86557 [Chytridium lagenaria]
MSDYNDSNNGRCSSSITDLFSAVYQELEFIADLGWSNAVQNAGFFQKFARTVNTAIEQYCDAIGMGELKAEVNNTGTTWTALLQSKQANGPKDITNESCVKLCNVEFALNKLDDMYRLMNVATLSRTVKDYRATMAPCAKNPPKIPQQPSKPTKMKKSKAPLKSRLPTLKTSNPSPQPV